VELIVIVGIGAIAAALGLGFGIVVAPRIGRLFDRIDANDEDARDGPD
jgi:hypothetical protein